VDIGDWHENKISDHWPKQDVLSETSGRLDHFELGFGDCGD
jgi:hypothetical protein